MGEERKRDRSSRVEAGPVPSASAARLAANPWYGRRGAEVSRPRLNAAPQRVSISTVRDLPPVIPPAWP